MIDDRLEEIDKLLNDNNLLDKYINILENSNFEVPMGLENRVLNGIYSKNSIEKKSNKFFDILKIVACTVVALCIWSSSLTSNTSYAANKSIKRSEFYTKFDSVVENISNFFMTPIIIEGREK